MSSTPDIISFAPAGRSDEEKKGREAHLFGLGLCLLLPIPKRLLQPVDISNEGILLDAHRGAKRAEDVDLVGVDEVH